MAWVEYAYTLPMMNAEKTSYGFYVDLAKTDDGDLAIVLTREGREESERIEEMRSEHGVHAALETLLEDHLGNGWELVPPEDIGALTSAPILSDEIERDDDGEITEVGRVYWYPDYQVRDEIEALRERLVVVFHGVPPV